MECPSAPPRPYSTSHGPILKKCNSTAKRAKTAKEPPDIKALMGNYSDEKARKILNQVIFGIDERREAFAILAVLAVKFSG